VAVTSYLFGGGAGAARENLSVIAGSLITVTALTFSLTVVSLQLASSQFSPRLLRPFTRDRFVHTTLAVFLATFTYTLMVLRTVRSADEDGEGGFVPQASVTLALLLALASVVTLVLRGGLPEGRPRRRCPHNSLGWVDLAIEQYLALPGPHQPRPAHRPVDHHRQPGRWPDRVHLPTRPVPTSHHAARVLTHRHANQQVRLVDCLGQGRHTQ